MFVVVEHCTKIIFRLAKRNLYRLRLLDYHLTTCYLVVAFLPYLEGFNTFSKYSATVLSISK